MRDTILQRSQGAGVLAVKGGEDRTRIARLRQAGCAKIRFPACHAADGFEAVLINTSGGLTGGDDLSWHIDALAGSRLTVTTQACEKIYRSTGDTARIDTRLVAGRDAHISWLPQETILFDGARLERTLEVNLDADATVLIVEAAVFGRQASGETCRAGRFRDRWRVRRSGHLVHREDLLFDLDAIEDPLRQRAVLDGNTAMASVLLVDQRAPGLTSAARAALESVPQVCLGASQWRTAGSEKLMVRMAAPDGYTLRKALAALIDALRPRAGLPRSWTI